MKGCALRLFASLTLLLGLMAGVAAWLDSRYGVEPRDAIGVSIAAGLLAWLSINLVMSAGTAWRNRSAIRRGMAGVLPGEGPATIVGVIQSTGPPLRAPLSDTPCVAYTFEVYDSRKRTSGKGPTKVVYCDGVALTPSTILTPAGSVRLLAVPELECQDTKLNLESARKRATEYARSIPFQANPPAFGRPEIEKRWNDDDGSYRVERRHIDGEVDLTYWRMSERCIETGARVCVFGHYSEAQRAIVPVRTDWSKQTRILKGDADRVARQLGASVIRRVLGAVLFAGLAAGVVAAFVAHTIG